MPAPMLSQPFAFVDLETTGGASAVDRITEVGIIEVDAGGVREWTTLVNPGVHISSFIEGLTGINDAMVADAPRFAEIADEVRTRLDGRIFVAHNARFDYGFLQQEFLRLGQEFSATVLCTVRLSRRLFPEHRKHNLDSLIERHGLEAGGRHRALADAQLIHQFWRQLRDGVEEDALAAAVTALAAKPKPPAEAPAKAL